MNLADAPPKKKPPSPQRERLLCPKCQHRMIDQSKGTESELHVIDDSDDWPADYYLKCSQCKAEIGLRKIK